DADASAVEVLVGYEERLAVGCGGQVTGAGALTLREDARIGFAFEHAVEREEDNAGVGKADGDDAGIGDDDDALRGLAAEGLPGDALEFCAFNAEDLNAGLNGALARDGDEDVLTIGGPDGLCWVAAGVEGADVKDLRGGDGSEAECDCKQQRAHEQPYRSASAQVSKELQTFGRRYP